MIAMKHETETLFIMRTRTELYLSKISEQIQCNQEHMALLRKEVYPEDYGKPMNYKDRLARQEGTGAYIHRQSRLSILKHLNKITNRLVVKYTNLIIKYSSHEKASAYHQAS